MHKSIRRRIWMWDNSQQWTARLNWMPSTGTAVLINKTKFCIINVATYFCLKLSHYTKNVENKGMWWFLFVPKGDLRSEHYTGITYKILYLLWKMYGLRLWCGFELWLPWGWGNVGFSVTIPWPIMISFFPAYAVSFCSGCPTDHRALHCMRSLICVGIAVKKKEGIAWNLRSNVYLLYQPNWANTEGTVLDKNTTTDTVESLVIKNNLVMLTSVKYAC